MSESWEIRGKQGGAKMAHAATRCLYTYWNRIRNGRPAPERREVEPAEIGRILSDTFILENLAGVGYPYRLAGTHVCSLFGKELKGEDWLAGWAVDDRPPLAEMVRAVIGEAMGAIIVSQGRNPRGQTVPLETVLLPLAGIGAADARVLGATAPLDAPYWLGAQPILEARITTLTHIQAKASASPQLPPFSTHTAGLQSAPVRRRGHLSVFEGGRLE